MALLLLLRGVLVSIVAVTLSRAAAVDKRNCATTVQHTGNMMLWRAFRNPWYNVADEQVGYIANAAAQTGFTVAPDGVPPAVFMFVGCQGGPSITIYCTSCDSNAEYSVVATHSVTTDVNGEPTNWWFYNAGAFPSWEDNPPTTGLPYSEYFTWGTDSLIRPVTFNDNEQDSNQGLLENAWWDTTSSTEIIFVPVTIGPGEEYYYLFWEEISQTNIDKKA